jgi:hypothetical protein
MVAMMVSNQSYAAYVSGTFQSGQNDLPSVTLDWTNRSGSTSGMTPFLRGRMNLLRSGSIEKNDLSTIEHPAAKGSATVVQTS